jgi:histidinol dehydrogenase
MTIIENPLREQWEALLARPYADSSDKLDALVRILADVKQRGDAALLDYAQRFDGARLQALAVTPAEMEAAAGAVPATLQQALRTAYANIKTFHAAQHTPEQVVETMLGVRCWRRSVPIGRVGLYIPGGTAPLFSTVLMLGIPAQLAGCSQVVLCTPPNAAGTVHPAILFAAQLCGISHVYKTGGAQAIAAMAYGTQTIARADKIFGPGNQYVTLAKMLVAQQGTAIDLPAGPSEVALLADDSAMPAFVAADLLSQAEHGADSQVLLITTRRQVAVNVMQEIEKQLALLPRAEVARAALAGSKAVVVANAEEMLALSDAYAPEHLIIATQDAEQLAARVQNAGSVFVGHYSPESVGDYASGTNHTLPTAGFARAYSGVSLDSFVKKITYQQLSAEGLQLLGPAVETMAEAEGLRAHRQAVSVRLEYIRNPNTVRA